MTRHKIAATNLFINLPIDAKMTLNRFMNGRKSHACTHTPLGELHHLSLGIVITLQLSTSWCKRYTDKLFVWRFCLEFGLPFAFASVWVCQLLVQQAEKEEEGEGEDEDKITFFCLFW